MGKFVGLNLNHDLLVKLTPEGVQAWKQKDDEQLRWLKTVFPLWKDEPKPLEYYVAQQDEAGYVAMSGFDFISRFGALNQVGGRYFSADLRIPAEQNCP
jgi:hypothetical protein